MAAPIQPMGTTSVIPYKRPKLGDSLYEHLKDYSEITSLAGTNLRWDAFDVKNEAARYFAYRYERNPDQDFEHPRFSEMSTKLKHVLEAVFGRNYKVYGNPNTGQDIIDRADEIEAEFYRRYGDPGEETEVEGDGYTPAIIGSGRHMKGSGHRLYGR